MERSWKSHAVEGDNQLRTSPKQRLVEWLRRREVYSQDKMIGISEMARSISRHEPQFLSPEFLLHLNELTLLIQGAGPSGVAVSPETTFTPLGDMPR